MPRARFPLNPGLLLGLGVALASCGRLAEIDDKVLIQTPGVSPGARPPGRPTRTSGGPEEILAFASRRIWLGGLDPGTGEKQNGVWRRMGYDLDGRTTTLEESAEGRDSCLRSREASLDVQRDGEDGRDNAFGAKLLGLLPLIDPSFATVERRLNESIERQGWPVFLVVLRELSQGPDDEQSAMGLYLARNEGFGEDPWTDIKRSVYDYRSSRNGSLLSIFNRFHGYMTGDTFVSGDLAEISPDPLLFPFDPATDSLRVRPRRLVLTMELDRTHREVRSSVMAGVLAVEDLVQALVPLVKDLGSPGFCGADREQRLEEILSRAADLRVNERDELEFDPQKPCNAISFGFHLEWQQTVLPIQQEYDYPPELEDRCLPP